MGYMHIENLYKNQEILMFKECYALEKINGTSAHISWNNEQLKFSSGGAKHETFVEIFDKESIIKALKDTGVNEVIVFGEAYGAKIQGKTSTYGKELKFVCFDVKINNYWLNVPRAETFCHRLGLEFVDYEKIPTDIASIDAEREKPSTQAIRNGCGNDKKREGIVLRPLIELIKNNGKRIICKHKNPEERETKSKRSMDPAKLKILSEAKEVAEEWVTFNRLNHVLSKIEDPNMEKMKEIILAMCEDVKREGEGEIIWSKAVDKAIGKRTAILTKQFFQNKLHE